MGRQEYLIDTNVTIEYIGEALPEKALSMLESIIDRRFYISVINKIELLGFSDITENEEQKFKEFINAADVLELDEDIVNSTIEVRKKYKIKLPDSIIAATALVKNLAIITRNVKDFDKIAGLEVLNSYNVETGVG
ncbi:MAG TPA: type II toxin-antitoxin system VapC family toxin [Bacteroidetes bacterium]|nr:type II toxin-antitoxin system VapC family toxin [Bacteroidota bacterium]